MAWVGAVVGGYAHPGPFDEGLNVVVPLGSKFGRLYGRDEDVAQVVFGQKLNLLVGQVFGFGPTFGKGFAFVEASKIASCPGRNRLMAAVQHQAGDLFDAEFGSQVFGSCISRLPPVFVDVEFAVFVEVFKSEAIHRQYFHPGVGGVSDALAALIAHQVKGFFLFFCPFLLGKSEHYGA